MRIFYVNPLQPSGHYMYHQFNTQQFHVKSTQYIYAIISLYSVNWPVFITERDCVYCAVRTGSIYVIQVNICIERAKVK